MNKTASGLIICLLLSVITTCHCVAQNNTASEKSLLEAWEELQKNDPKTLEFTRTEANSYQFHTERFPYNGRLIVLNTSITESPAVYDKNYLMGVIEVNLPDLPENFYTIHSHSFSMWQQNNYLYFDQEQNRWLDAREWQTQIMETSAGSPWWSCIGSFWFIFLIILIIFLFLFSRKASSQMKSAMTAQNTALKQQQKALDDQQRAMEMTEQSLVVIQEIRDLLKQLVDRQQRFGS